MLERARTIEDLQSRLSRFISDVGLRRAQAFRPRPDDVIIATYPKSGTTWMQQILHGLRTRGDMDFDEITEVTPWIELAHDLGWDLEGDQRARPRVFKSHWNGYQVPSGCRVVCVIRDPLDTMISFYHFMNGWLAERDAIPIDDFVRWVALRKHHAGDYWSHLLSFWERRLEADVHLVTFEDLKEDLSSSVRAVAEFIGLGHDEKAIAIATRQARFEFMKAHESHFDDHLIAAARNAACGVPAEARSTKVRTGTTRKEARGVSPRTLELLRTRWDAEVRMRTGFADYEALRAAVRRGASSASAG